MATAQATAKEPNFYQAAKGWKNWLVTLDHKRIGLMYLVGIVVSFLLGGAFALLIRAELFMPGQQLIDRDFYNQAYTVHGAIMVFLVIIPGIPAALGNMVLPIQLGAPDVAFPRLNLASFYLWVIGCFFLLLSLFMSAVDTGWTFYTPYSTTTGTAVVPAVTGAFVLGFSSIFTGVNFIVTIHKFKPAGMGWFKMPLNLWAIYATATIQVLATPVLGITLMLLWVERVLGIGIFDPALGGDPVLFQHFFWFYSHPAVYIMILPAMGVISEIITTGAHKHIFGYRFIAYSSISLALLSFIVWGHHMFVAGQSKLAIMVFSALTFTVAIPSAIKVFNWVGTLYKGDIHITTPMLFALYFILLFGIGGLTGLFLGTLSTDVFLHDTYFVVAHFHYVMMGSTLIAFLAGIHYWWPKIIGKMFNDRIGCWLATIIFLGFNVTFLPQFVMGSNGMHRRYFDYDPEFTTMHQWSTIGAFVMGIALFAMFVNLFVSIFKGKKAPDNPWGGTTLEWQAPTPPSLYNFPENEPPPELHEIYDYSDLEFISEEEGWVRRSEQAEKSPRAKQPEKADADEAADKAEKVAAKDDKADKDADKAEKAAAKDDEDADKAQKAEAKGDEADKAEKAASTDDDDADKAEKSEAEGSEKAETSKASADEDDEADDAEAEKAEADSDSDSDDKKKND